MTFSPLEDWLLGGTIAENEYEFGSDKFLNTEFFIRIKVSEEERDLEM